MDNERYGEWQEEEKKEWELICLNCGACCGAHGDDPCSNVYLDGDKYFCRIYDRRLGRQKTVKGVEFHCVPVRNIIHHSWPGDWRCAYKKLLKKSPIDYHSAL